MKEPQLVLYIDRRAAFLAYLDFNINNFHLHSAHGVHALYYCSPAKYAQRYITSDLDSKLPWLFNIQCVDFWGSKLQAPKDMRIQSYHAC